jgi:mannitol/fructose-specific phosphotransferase system IIA component (Ntr-type)
MENQAHPRHPVGRQRFKPNMRSTLSGILTPKQIRLNLPARTETEAINEVAEILDGDPRVLNFDSFRAELFTREKLSPTALGNGVAFPHARCNHVKQLVMAVGRSPGGVLFEKCPQKVQLIFLIGTPTAAIREYLALLAALAAVLKQSTFIEKLMHCGHAEEFFSILTGGG